METPTVCSGSVQLRRNPHRNGRHTPSSIPVVQKLRNLPQPENTSSNHQPPEKSSSIHQKQREPAQNTESSSESLKVYLRIRPQVISRGRIENTRQANHVRPQPPNKKSKEISEKNKESCITVNDGFRSVTVLPPASLQDSKRLKSEVFEGFSRVFPLDSSQEDVYEQMVKPLVEQFVKGKSEMLAALGPSGSGKTYTTFGTPKQPGIVPLALHQIFQMMPNGSFCLSVFEIYSEQGKTERICDLSQQGTEMSMHQSAIKGLQKVPVFNASHAESLISCALLKRATAMTSTNSQSSRSQCVINIHYTPKDGGNESCNDVVLTFIDLAGAEREKRTRNQGSRLLESNFINKTVMVFGQCLRSLLEHQRNPKKPLQKHFQNSLLTKYLRGHLEGKKRMTLILTVKPDSESYQDTVNLLRQASPFTNITFDTIEDTTTMPVNKRRLQECSEISFSRRKKIKRDDPLKNDEEPEPKSEKTECSDSLNNRNHAIMQNFARAMWKVLKEVNGKLKTAEKEIRVLNEKSETQMKKCAELESELRILKHFQQKRCEEKINPISSFGITKEEKDSEKKIGQDSEKMEPEKTLMLDCDSNEHKNCEKKINPEISHKVHSIFNKMNDSEKMQFVFKEQTDSEKRTERKNPSTSPVSLCKSMVKNALKGDEKNEVVKQKRRLLPASANLLRDINAFVENDPPNPKCDIKDQVSAGSATLMRLLQSNSIN